MHSRYSLTLLKGEIFFELSAFHLPEEVLKLDVRDSKGALVMSMKGNKAELQKNFKSNSLKLASGLYIIRLQTSKATFTQKFIKQGF